MMAWVTECVRPCVTAWVRSVVIDRAAANVSGFVESATILWVIAGPATIEIACANAPISSASISFVIVSETPSETVMRRQKVRSAQSMFETTGPSVSSIASGIVHISTATILMMNPIPIRITSSSTSR